MFNIYYSMSIGLPQFDIDSFWVLVIVIILGYIMMMILKGLKCVNEI